MKVPLFVLARPEEGKLQLGLTAVSQGLVYRDLNTEIPRSGLSPL